MPEEINRVVTDHLSSLHFCPTSKSVSNLAAEGVVKGVHHVGDVMYDPTLFATAMAEKGSVILSELGLKPMEYALATIHRAENTDHPHQLRTVVEFLQERALTCSGVAVTPAHATCSIADGSEVGWPAGD